MPARFQVCIACDASCDKRTSSYAGLGLGPDQLGQASAVDILFVQLCCLNTLAVIVPKCYMVYMLLRWPSTPQLQLCFVSSPHSTSNLQDGSSAGQIHLACIVHNNESHMGLDSLSDAA